MEYNKDKASNIFSDTETDSSDSSDSTSDDSVVLSDLSIDCDKIIFQ